jgi:RND family efflux transporter MFP subunit
VSAPISGTITQKFVSTGDSINAGQSIATISKLNKIEIQFFVNKEELSYFKIGDEISIKENNLAYPGKITLISPQADETTKRFLVEATPIENKQLIIGSVVSVEFSIDYLPQSNENIILPLSAITISQNESYIFIAKDQKVQKVSVVIVKVFGEMAEIKTSLAPQDEIVTDGSRIIKEGDEIVIKK